MAFCFAQPNGQLPWRTVQCPCSLVSPPLVSFSQSAPAVPAPWCQTCSHRRPRPCHCPLCGLHVPRPVVLKAWALEQQQWHRLGPFHNEDSWDPPQIYWTTSSENGAKSELSSHVGDSSWRLPWVSTAPAPSSGVCLEVTSSMRHTWALL